MATGVRWKRSDEGFVDSHCGRWHIKPLYFGCVKPQFYELYRDGQRQGVYYSTQADAKFRADQLLLEEKRSTNSS